MHRIRDSSSSIDFRKLRTAIRALAVHTLLLAAGPQVRPIPCAKTIYCCNRSWLHPPKGMTRAIFESGDPGRASPVGISHHHVSFRTAAIVGVWKRDHLDRALLNTAVTSRVLQVGQRRERGKTSCVSEGYVNRPPEYLRDGHGCGHRVESQGHDNKTYYCCHRSLSLDQEQIAHHDKSNNAAAECTQRGSAGRARHVATTGTGVTALNGRREGPRPIPKDPAPKH